MQLPSLNARQIFLPPLATVAYLTGWVLLWPLMVARWAWNVWPRLRFLPTPLPLPVEDVPLWGVRAAATLASVVATRGVGAGRGPLQLCLLRGLEDGFALRVASAHEVHHQASGVEIPLFDPLEGLPGAEVLLQGHAERVIGVVEVRIEGSEDHLGAFLHLRVELVVTSLGARVREDAEGEVIGGDVADHLRLFLALHGHGDSSGQRHALLRVRVIVGVDRLHPRDRDQGRGVGPELAEEAADEGVSRIEVHAEADVVPHGPRLHHGLLLLEIERGLDVGGRRWGLFDRQGPGEDAPRQEDCLAEAGDIDVVVGDLEGLDLVAEGRRLGLVAGLREEGGEVSQVFHPFLGDLVDEQGVDLGHLQHRLEASIREGDVHNLDVHLRRHRADGWRQLRAGLGIVECRCTEWGAQRAL